MEPFIAQIIFFIIQIIAQVASFLVGGEIPILT